VCDNGPSEGILLSALPDPCFVLDREWRFIYVNPAAEKLLDKMCGTTVGTILGRVIWQDCREVGESTLFTKCKQALAERKSVEGETFYPVLKQHFAIRVWPVGDSLAVLFRDITEPTELKRDLLRANERLTEAERARSALLIPLAHEVRNVLSVSRNAFHLLDGRDLGQEGACACALAERELCRMSRLLDDLLLISQLSTMSSCRQQINLSEVVGEAVTGILSSGEIVGEAVTLRVATEPLWLDADPAQLESVCQHLLGHVAHVSGSRGALRVTTEREGADVVLRVREEGMRLAPETVAHLSRRSDHRENRDLVDWGWQVGLGLVRQLVELHGGSMETRRDAGNLDSEFIVRLPAAVEKATGLGPSEDSPFQILVVDDNVELAHSMTLMLKHWGWHVEMVHDGAAALKAVRSNHPNLVVLDIALPGMDGYEVARRLRQEQGKSRLTLVALTGYSQGKERDRALEAGFDYHMVKPVNPRDLKALVQEVQGSEQGPSSLFG
jgi:CheY-like chemotaxis protein/signal transduction histidine kinase